MIDGRVDRWSRALVHRRQLTPASWYVLCELLERDADLVTVTSRQLASAVGLGRDATRGALRELEARRLIARARNRGDSGRFGSLAYIVLRDRAVTRPRPEDPARATTRVRRPRNASPTSCHQLDQLSLLSDELSAT